MADWKKIKAEYIRTKVSYRKLAEKYGVSPSTLYRRMTKEKWADLRKQSESKASAKIVDKVASIKADEVDKVQTTADMLLNTITHDIQNGSIFAYARGVSDITKALKDIRDIKGCKSELDIQEQMARIDKLRKEAQIEEDRNDVKVVIADDLKDFAE